MAAAAVRSAPTICRSPESKTKERPKAHESQFLREANLTPRNIAPFCHAGRWRLAGAPRLRSRRQAPSAADLLASMRAKFNAVPLETQKLADNVTMLSGPGGSVVALSGPAGQFVVDTFVAPTCP